MEARGVTRAQCNIGLPMTETELRAKVRELMASGLLRGTGEG